jgi:hypothetical protein
MKLKLKKKQPAQVQMKSTEISTIRSMLLGKQNHRCPICENVIIDAVLDHSHKRRIKGTGLCRGVLCRMCNVFLAKAENNCTRYGIGQKNLPKILRNIADYLDKPHTNFIHPSEKPKPKRLTRASYNKLKKVYDGKFMFPSFPGDNKRSSGALTVPLKKLFEKYNIEPEFYTN